MPIINFNYLMTSALCTSIDDYEHMRHNYSYGWYVCYGAIPLPVLPEIMSGKSC